MDQQRVIDKMKAERRETICVQAHQRQELEKDLIEAEKKVLLSPANATIFFFFHPTQKTVKWPSAMGSMYRL